MHTFRQLSTAAGTKCAPNESFSPRNSGICHQRWKKKKESIVLASCCKSYKCATNGWFKHYCTQYYQDPIPLRYCVGSFQALHRKCDECRLVAHCKCLKKWTNFYECIAQWNKKKHLDSLDSYVRTKDRRNQRRTHTWACPAVAQHRKQTMLSSSAKLVLSLYACCGWTKGAITECTSMAQLQFTHSAMYAYNHKQSSRDHTCRNCFFFLCSLGMRAEIKWYGLSGPIQALQCIETILCCTAVLGEG